MTRLISTNHSYDQIEEIIEPYYFSIRESVDPLHLHKYTMLLHKFTAKRELVDYLNMEIEKIERKKREKTGFDNWAFSYDLEDER